MKNEILNITNEINDLKESYNERLAFLNLELINLKFNDGQDLTVKDTALFLGLNEMTVRAYANPARNILIAIKKNNVTFITNDSINKRK